MAKASDYLENQILNHLLRTGSYTKPSTIYVGLYSAAPSDSGGGTEISGNGYARVQVGPGDSSWGAPSGGNGTTTNLAAVSFPTPTGSGWGTVTHFALFDAATSGNMLMWGALDAPQVVGAGNTLTIPIGGLTVVAE